MLTLSWWRKFIVCEPEGEGRYAFFPCGYLWRGHLLHDHDRDEILDRHARLTQAHFALLVVILAVAWYLIGNPLEHGLIFLATVVTWVGVGCIYYAFRYAHLPRSATQPSFSRYLADVERRFDGFSTGHLRSQILVFSALPALLLYSFVRKPHSPTFGDAFVATLTVLFWFVAAPTIFRILRRRRQARG